MGKGKYVKEGSVLQYSSPVYLREQYLRPNPPKTASPSSAHYSSSTLSIFYCYYVSSIIFEGSEMAWVPSVSTVEKATTRRKMYELQWREVGFLQLGDKMWAFGDKVLISSEGIQLAHDNFIQFSERIWGEVG